MVYSDIEVKPEDLSTYYASTRYWPHDEIDQERLGVTADLLASTFSHVSTILDFGCASGELMEQLSERGFLYVDGCDLSERSVAAARDRGFAVDTEPPYDEYDLIVMSHVLEHVQDPAAVISRLGELLAPGGSFYIEVPDASRFAEFVFEPFLDFNLEHINHFSPNDLQGLMGRLGYSVETLSRKTMQLTQGWTYPAVFGLFNRDGTTLNDYIAESEKREREMHKRLMASLAGRKRVVVRGVGQLALRRLASLHSLEIVAYVDADPHKQTLTFDGKRVQSPSEPIPEDVPVVVLSAREHDSIRADYPNNEVICLV